MVEDDYTFDDELPDDERMIVNMGPQHPSTHGVLRLQIELEGEMIRRTKPIIGYLHTGMEKTGEGLTFMQGPTNVTRMDYLAPYTTNWPSRWLWSACWAWRSHPRPGNPDSDDGAQPDLVASGGDGDQRHGYRSVVDLHLRLP